MAIAAAQGMLARRHGVIVNVASQLALKAAPDRAVYGATKAALVHFTKSAAAEWVTQGVRVVAIAPGPIETPMVRDLLAVPATAEKLLASMPIGRLLNTKEVSELIHFLASPAADSIAGQLLVADGGNLLTFHHKVQATGFQPVSFSFKMRHWRCRRWTTDTEVIRFFRLSTTLCG